MTQTVFHAAGVEPRYNVKTPMRDGVKLSADIYLPAGQPGPFPVILGRTPYDNTTAESMESAVFYPQHRYVFMAQDVRGRNDSDGDFNPGFYEYDDGYDTIEWIGAQPWCDGNVGMVGGSYVGSVQWQAAIMGGRYLKAIVPRVAEHNTHAVFNQGGAWQLAVVAMWGLRYDGRTRQDIYVYNWAQLFDTLPLKDLDKTAGKDIKIPVLQIGGWYDIGTGGTFANFVGMRERGGSQLAREQQKAIIRPWFHDASAETHAGEVDFGMDSVVDLMEIELRWFDHWLKGVPNGVKQDGPLRIYVMGANEWRDEHEWPLARTQFTNYYFHSGGSANSLLGDGKLSTEPPAEEPADHLVYNPAFPVPTRGGNTCCNPDLVPWGGYDQRSIEYRNDMLVYTSDPLEEDMEVTGPVFVKLFAGTDGRDTDFTAKLVDVSPDGYAVNLCDGIIRGRYRTTQERQTLLDPGEVYEFTIDLWPTSNVFKKGHRIRVDISSSNFPRFDRNPNTGNAFGQDAELRIARQQVFHDKTRASHIILPVIPKS